jgi:hypothetical protein
VSRCLLSDRGWGLVANDRVEYDVGHHCCPVVKLIVVVCFFKNVVPLYAVEQSPFFGGMQLK